MVALLAGVRPHPLQLQAAAVLQSSCPPADVRNRITPGCIRELASRPDFESFNGFLGADPASPPTPNGSPQPNVSQRSGNAIAGIPGGVRPTDSPLPGGPPRALLAPSPPDRSQQVPPPPPPQTPGPGNQTLKNTFTSAL